MERPSMDIFLYVVKLDDEMDSAVDLESRRNALLDVYSLYLKTGIQAVKEEVILKAYELHLRDPQFSFVI